MGAAYLKLSIQKGQTFGRTFLISHGAIFTITAFSDAGGGNVTVHAPGHIFVDGAKIVVAAENKARGIVYYGSFTIANVVAGVSFTIVAAWQGSISGSAQAAKDLTGQLFRAKGSSAPGEEIEFLVITGAIPDPTGGVVTIAAASDKTDLDITNSAVWGGEFYDEADPPVVDPLFYGALEITQEGS